MAWKVDAVGWRIVAVVCAEEYLSEDPTCCDGGKRRNVVQQSKRIIDDQQPTTSSYVSSGPDRIMNSQLLRYCRCQRACTWQGAAAWAGGCVGRRELCSFNIGVTRY
eukprot:scaffold12887_cov80-Skeletonema_marinoi.AAC.1